MARSDKIPRSVIKQLISDARADPQLPRPNPTEAFWQVPEADHSNIQSPDFPAIGGNPTYAIIGSGITACSVAKHLLELGDQTSTVVILEARGLTSGATGRNGGHLLSPLHEEFTQFEKALGKDETIKIARYANRTLESMYKLANENDPDLANVSEARRVRSVVGYYDKALFEETRKSCERYEECLPEAKGDHRMFTAEEALEGFNMKGTVGAVTYSAGAFWPYRLVTGLHARMLKRYPDRFFIETHTPVTKVDCMRACTSRQRLKVTTPRGTMIATRVIYCTNGWTGHLLPELRGKIFPLRGTMSVQEPGPHFPNEGDQKSWSTLSAPAYDSAEDTFSYGLYYITQNAHTGDIFIGGEKQKATELLTSDDTSISEISKSTLERVLPTIYAKGAENPTIRKVWSGIMGFTPDHMPWIGQIPNSIVNRRARSQGAEYIAAGFNGYGMPLCWGAGEAVAKMILGDEEEVMEWLPESFLITEKRLNSPSTSIEFGMGLMFWDLLGWWTRTWLSWRYLRVRIWKMVMGLVTSKTSDG